MKKTRLLAVLLTLLLAVGLLASCGAKPDSSLTSEPTTEGAFTDMMGRPIDVELPLGKVVVLTPSDCEILFAIGAGDMVVGRGEYCDYPAEVESIEAVQSGEETNIEQIVSLKPDAVIMNTMDQTEEQVEALEKAGIPVIMTDANRIEEVYEAIALIGTVTGKTDEANTLTKSMQQEFEEVALASHELERQSIYFEVSPLEYGLWSAGAGTFMDEISKMINMDNIFGNIKGWDEVSEEQVIELNPDYIVTIAMDFGEEPGPVDEIIGRDGWSQLKAVETGHIFNADSDELSRPGPRLVDGARALLKFIQEAQGVAVDVSKAA